MTKVLPKYFYIQTEVIVDEDNQTEEDKHEEQEEIAYVEKAKKGTEVVVNGVHIDLDMSLTWLVMNMTAFDNFLYVSVRLPRKKESD